MVEVEIYQSEASHIHEMQDIVLAGYRANHGPNGLLDVSAFALSTRGKMLRSRLLLEACRAVGGSTEALLIAAAGIEFGHLASLIHDDLIDGDELRRGEGTIWKVYDKETAILSGDLFLFAAFHSLSLCRHSVPEERVARAFEVVSLAGVELCLGQASEGRLSGKCSIDREDYLRMIQQKTGSLLRASVETGAVLGGGSEEQISALRKYGNLLGTAFQIIDDLLPYISRESMLRKSAQSDLKNRRITLPIIYALQESTAQEHEMLCAIFENAYLENAYDEAKEIVTNILWRTGALEYARQEARNYQQEALRQLECLPENTGRTYLVDLAGSVISRSF